MVCIRSSLSCAGQMARVPQRPLMAQISKRGTPCKAARLALSVKVSDWPVRYPVPGDLRSGERRAAIVLCHGYTGVRDLYLPDIANVLCEAAYVVLTFDYKGWGDSDGPKSRLAPNSRVIDVQSAVTWLGAQEFVDPERLGIYGTSYGGATVV